MSEHNETLAEIVAMLRANARGKRFDAFSFTSLADHIEAIARRAYNEIDTAVCSIEDASHFDIDDVRKAMARTIGDYYE